MKGSLATIAAKLNKQLLYVFTYHDDIVNLCAGNHARLVTKDKLRKKLQSADALRLSRSTMNKKLAIVLALTAKPMLIPAGCACRGAVRFIHKSVLSLTKECNASV